MFIAVLLVASHSPFCVKRIEHCRPGCWKSTNYYCQGGALGTWSVSASHQPLLCSEVAVGMLECSHGHAHRQQCTVDRQPPYLVVLASRLGWSAGLLGRHDGITVEPAAVLCFLGSPSCHHLMVPLSETTGACCWHGRYFERQVLALCSVQHYLFSILSRPFPSRAPDGTKDSLQLGNEGSPRTSRYRHTLTRKARSPGPPRSYCRSVSHHHQKIRRQTDITRTRKLKNSSIRSIWTYLTARERESCLLKKLDV